MSHDVILMTSGPRVLEVVKVLRTLGNLSFMEAVRRVKMPNAVVMSGVSWEAATAARQRLERVGETVAIR